MLHDRTNSAKSRVKSIYVFFSSEKIVVLRYESNTFVSLRSSGKEKTCSTWYAELWAWGRRGSLGSSTTSRTRSLGWRWKRGWVKSNVAPVLLTTISHVMSHHYCANAYFFGSFIVPGPGPRGTKGGAHHPSLPGQVLPWKCWRGAGARHHTASLLPASK